MTDSQVSILKNKSLIVCGGTYEDRQAFIAEAKQFFSDGREKNVYSLGENIKDTAKYIKSVQREFPIEPVLPGVTKDQMSYDQLNDCYLNWTAKRKNLLIIIPEFDKFMQASLERFHEVLGRYLAEQASSGLRLLMTLAKPIALDYSLIPKFSGGGWHPSSKNLAIIDMIKKPLIFSLLLFAGVVSSRAEETATYASTTYEILFEIPKNISASEDCSGGSYICFSSDNGTDSGVSIVIYEDTDLDTVLNEYGLFKRQGQQWLREGLKDHPKKSANISGKNWKGIYGTASCGLDTGIKDCATAIFASNNRVLIADAPAGYDPAIFDALIRTFRFTGEQQ